MKKSEAVSKAQHVRFIDALSRGEVEDEPSEADPSPDDPGTDANQRLREASDIDDPG